MMNWLKFDKIEGNTCNSCGQTGINQWFDQDGMTIYSWQKPKTKPCERCQYDEYDKWCKGFTVQVNGKSMSKMKNKFKIIDACSGEKLRLGEGRANEL